MGGLGALDFMPGANDLVVASGDFRDGAGQLRGQLGHLEDGEGLSLVDAVADIDVNVANEAGDLGVDVDNLVRLELAGEREDLVDAAALGPSDLSGGRPGSSFNVFGPAMAAPKQKDNRDGNDRSGNEDPQTLSHIRISPILWSPGAGLGGL